MKNLSELLGVSEKQLWHAYSLARSDRGYDSFEIPKRSGSARKIDKPVQNLFRIQGLIKLHILDNAPEQDDYVTAFRKGLSITNNAMTHCNKAIVVKFDLKDFFPTISFTRVASIFARLGFDESDAMRLAYLTTKQLSVFNEPPSTLLHFERLRCTKITENWLFVVNA